MKGHASRYFNTADLEALFIAADLVAAMPDDDRSCHDVCAEVADQIGFKPTHGDYGGVDHSWFRLSSGNILDVYAPGRFPPVALIHVQGTFLPEATLYRERA